MSNNTADFFRVKNGLNPDHMDRVVGMKLVPLEHHALENVESAWHDSNHRATELPRQLRSQTGYWEQGHRTMEARYPSAFATVWTALSISVPRHLTGTKPTFATIFCPASLSVKSTKSFTSPVG